MPGIRVFGFFFGILEIQLSVPSSQSAGIQFSVLRSQFSVAGGEDSGGSQAAHGAMPGIRVFGFLPRILEIQLSVASF